MDKTGRSILAGDRRALRILFITPYVPSLLRTRAFNLVKHLSQQGHRITVIAVRSSQEDERDAVLLRQYCARVETIHVPLSRSLWNCLRGSYGRLPLQALYCDSPNMRARLAAELNGTPQGRPGSPGTEPYDVVHVEHLRAVVFGLQVVGFPRVYDSVDCISRLFEKTLHMGATRASRLKAFVDLERTRRFEGRLVARFDRVLTTSDLDKEALADLSERFAPRPGANASDRGRSGAISVLPHGVDLEYFTPTREPRQPATLVYLGRMAYHANVTAVMHFVQNVMPLIWAQRPDTKLLIVGKDPHREIRSLPRRYGARVVVTGYVPDVRPYVASATVSVSPLVYAVGVQNKILEAMAMATPVVTTRAGMAPLLARDGEHVLVATDAADFAGHVLRLVDDRALQQRIGDGGRRYVETHHDWKQIVKQLQEIYHQEVASFGHRTGSNGHRTVEDHALSA